MDVLIIHRTVGNNTLKDDQNSADQCRIGRRAKCWNTLFLL